MKLLYFNGPTVDRGVFQPEGLEFRYIKARLACAPFEEPNEPLQAIDVISQSIEEATLEHVFQEWMDRLAQCYVAVDGLAENA
jgi:hypothetical protein